MEASEILEAAFKTDLLYADLILDQVLASLANFYLIDKLGIGLPRS
jgi:hypothetical protein